jgi:hypothetical protein
LGKKLVEDSEARECLLEATVIVAEPWEEREVWILSSPCVVELIGLRSRVGGRFCDASGLALLGVEDEAGEAAMLRARILLGVTRASVATPVVSTARDACEWGVGFVETKGSPFSIFAPFLALASDFDAERESAAV